MFHNGFTRRAAVLAAMATLMLAAGAQAEETKCRRTIAKATAKYESARLKALQKCNDGVLKEKITPPCPDAKAAEKIAGAMQKLSDDITGDCELADITAVLGGTCTRFGIADESGSCDVPVTTVAEAVTCFKCLSETNVDGMISFLFDGKTPSSDGDTLKCQRSIGKNGSKFFAKKRKALQKCADGVIKEGSGSCPDAKANDKIGKAAAKLAEKLDKDCEGLDQADFGGISYCPGLDIPGVGPACAGPLHTLADLKECVYCIMEYKADCLTSVSTPSVAALPAECTPTCGDGGIDAGETCDDGNADNFDACPSDCTVNACSNPGAGPTATINLQGVPGGTDLSSLIVFVTYPDGEARIPGSGNDPSVSNALTATNGTASLTPNDLDYGIRILAQDPFLPLGNSPVTIAFDACNGATITDSDFDCFVEEIFDTGAQSVPGVTCSVDVP
jgi:cysteine-rich repeat protein